METNAKVKFENDNDFTSGVISMGNMLETWQKTSDEGYKREFTLTPNRESLTLEILLKVTK